MSATAILAIGSPFGADRIGWQIAEQLLLQKRENVHVCRHPIDLLQYFAQYKQCYVIDALWADSMGDGEMIQLQPEELKKRHCLGSHGLTLYEVIQLAKISGQLPEQVRIIGINISKRSTRAFSDAEIRSLVDRLSDVAFDLRAAG